MDTIFSIISVLFIGAISIIIFIQTNVELWNEVGKDLWNEMKHKFNDTKVGMWHKNRKNGVEILSDRKYKYLVKSGQIKNTIIVED